MAAAIPLKYCEFWCDSWRQLSANRPRCRFPGRFARLSTVIRAIWKRGGGRIRRAVRRHADRPMTSDCRVANDEDCRVEGAFRRSDANRAVFFADSLAS